MRQVSFVVLTLLLNTGVYSQENHEIYKQVICDFVVTNQQPGSEDDQSTTLIVLKRPAYVISLDNNDYSRFKGKYKAAFFI